MDCLNTCNCFILISFLANRIGSIFEPNFTIQDNVTWVFTRITLGYPAPLFVYSFIQLKQWVLINQKRKLEALLSHNWIIESFKKQDYFRQISLNSILVWCWHLMTRNPNLYLSICCHKKKEKRRWFLSSYNIQRWNFPLIFFNPIPIDCRNHISRTLPLHLRLLPLPLRLHRARGDSAPIFQNRTRIVGFWNHNKNITESVQ